ncbi:MAG: hypothetical protein FJ011_16310 [Chloroflexi bacterium]|nr:hypothetical protein [Chloroflexota bacterium]
MDSVERWAYCVLRIAYCLLRIAYCVRHPRDTPHGLRTTRYGLRYYSRSLAIIIAPIIAATSSTEAISNGTV